MLAIIMECKLKTKSKKLFRLVTLFVAAFSISTPTIMYFSTGEATLNLFVEGFWIIGLLQSLVFVTIVDYYTESKHASKYFSATVKTNMRQTNGKWRPVDMPIGGWNSKIQGNDPFAEFHDELFEKEMRQNDPFYAHEVDNIWHGTHLDSSSEEYWK